MVRKWLGLLLIALMASFVAPTQSAEAKTSYRHYKQGKLDAPTPGSVSGGLLLMGGGDRNYDAMRWFFSKAGNGHILVLRASQEGQIGKEFYSEIGGIQSAETFVFLDRAASTNEMILDRIRKADGIFLAGGDQSRYVRFWRGTPVEDLLNAHVKAGKPLAGTSAGLAILGEKLYGAMDDGSIKSPEALAAPFGSANTIEGDFLTLDLMKGIVTDTHFKERDRLGRLMAFVAKAQADRPATQSSMFGLGVDESAAVAVEPDGSARIYATEPTGGAWLVHGENLRGLPTSGPLDVARVKVTGIGHQSKLILPAGTVTSPSFEKNYAVVRGTLSEVPRWSIAIHGGAGVIERANFSPEKEKAYRAALAEALQAGGKVLDGGGTSLDAITAAIHILEDSPLFNAGRGAVFTAEGRNELDASIMDGKTQKAGAVAGVTRTRHPIDLARAVMDKTRHVMLASAGADKFSIEQGLEQVDPKWFRTEERWQQLEAWRAKQQAAVDPTHLFGTVGAVAVDSDGNLAAGTSTGGMTGKRWGRVGDSPIIGAGTYAKNNQCAVSATGSGEYFIRESAARQVCDRVLWNKQSLADAAQATIMSVGAIGGDGGLIAMGPLGKPAFAINDLGMYRGSMTSGGSPKTAIFADEKIAE